MKSVFFYGTSPVLCSGRTPPTRGSSPPGDRAMSGTVHSVISRRQFTFTNVSASNTLDVPLVRAIDVTDAKAIDVVVRVHALTVSSTASITIFARPISLTNEEPDVDFTNATDLGTITLNTSTAAAPV